MKHLIIMTLLFSPLIHASLLEDIIAQKKQQFSTKIESMLPSVQKLKLELEEKKKENEQLRKQLQEDEQKLNDCQDDCYDMQVKSDNAHNNGVKLALLAAASGIVGFGLGYAMRCGSAR